MAFNERTNLLINDSRLRSSCVAVFGIGGVGSYTAEALVRAGLGSIILIDPDRITESNINRQLIALRSNIGELKTEAAKKRYLDINPELNVFCFNEFILPENAESVFSAFPVRPDYAADAIDTVSGKLAIIEYCKKNGISIISSMGTGNKLHPERFEIDDISKTSVCPLCRVMRRELKARSISGLDVVYSKEDPIKTGDTVIGSISTVPSSAGLLMANHIIMNLN